MALNPQECELTPATPAVAREVGNALHRELFLGNVCPQDTCGDLQNGLFYLTLVWEVSARGQHAHNSNVILTQVQVSQPPVAMAHGSQHLAVRGCEQAPFESCGKNRWRKVTSFHVHSLILHMIHSPIHTPGR
jgi:hypothetical protein